MPTKPSEPNRDSSDPEPSEDTPGPRSPLATHPLGGLAPPRFPAPSTQTTELPTKHTDAQRPRCLSLLFRPVTEVAAPSQVVTRQTSERPRSGLLGTPEGSCA